jgi:ATP synthase mitochondrial F1 complex assembly factor 1
MSKFLELDAKCVPEVWSAHFSQKPDNFGVSLPSKLAALIKPRFSEYPMFIMPLARMTGHDIVLLQASVNENLAIHVTKLEEYKKLGSAAPILASFTFFNELIQEKDLVLIHGIFDGSLTNYCQSKSLVQNICAAYSDDELFKWVREFQDRPNEFNFDGFMRAFTPK